MSIRRPSLPDQQYVNNVAKWQHDKDISRCTHCQTKFSFFERRHHCRCCGNIFCHSCTANFVRYDRSKVLIVKRPDSDDPDEETAPYRTCDSCYNNLLHLGLIIATRDRTRSDASGSIPASLSERSTNASSINGNSLEHSNISGFPINMEDTTRSATTEAPTVSEPTSTHGNSQEDNEDDEDNTCPICNIDFKILSPENDSTVIEQHIEDCIRRAERAQQHQHSPQDQTIPVSSESTETTTDTTNSNNDNHNNNEDRHCPTSRNRMLVYKIPQPKDKTVPINEDDYEECPICFENMLPGEKVGRLECLCVFHYHCIKSWFVKKSQQVAAIDGINNVGKNFCPLHDAVL